MIESNRLWLAAGPLILASIATAEVHTFEVCCRGAQVVPPVTTSGRAALTVVVDDLANAVQVSGTFQSLMGDISIAAMHGPAPPDQSGSFIMTMDFTGATSGTVSANTTIDPADVQTILAGLAYVDLHSTFAPGGEVRGQVANNGVTYCPARSNSVGAGATLRVAGCRVVADQDVRLVVEGLPAGVPGLFFFGPTQSSVAFGDGTRCVGGATVRVRPFAFADGSGHAALTLDFQAGYASSIVSGTDLNFQLWYRDGANGGAGFNTSSAVEVAFL